MEKIIYESSYLDFADAIIDLFNAKRIEYMIIGGGALILHGQDYTTQDIDFYIKDEISNNEKVIEALLQLGFDLTEQSKSEIKRGKDFIQFNRPFPLDLVYYPDGFESYEEAERYKEQKGKYPLLSVSGIVRSKKAANRPKDRLHLPFIEEFDKFISDNRLYLEDYSDKYFDIEEGYELTDFQTLNRWSLNIKDDLKERLKRGIR